MSVIEPGVPAARRAKFIIIGTGFSGLGMAIRLKQQGEHNLLILERSDSIGGVWRDNHYPGAACDVQSHLYSFSFTPNPNWTHHYSPQGEILAYLEECSQRFKGQVFHSATWPRDFDPRGRRVAVVGTGASAIQFIPAIQPQVDRMYVFQRTPPWVIPRQDGPISPRLRALYRRLPLLQRGVRLKIYLGREFFVVGFRHPRLMQLVQKSALKHLYNSIRDPGLRAKLTPRYTLGCKRILISNDYYPAVARPNVEVITSGIAEVTESDILGVDGVQREMDAIIFGTGFLIKDPPFARYIRGADGRTLAETWASSPQAYMGTTVAGFPNLFLVPGPNTGLGHTSVIYMSEAQIEHILRLLKHMEREGFDIIEPTATAQQRFTAAVQRQMQGPFGRQVAAIAGTWTTRAATRPCGRASRSIFGGERCA